MSRAIGSQALARRSESWVCTGSGAETDVVLKRLLDAQWLAREPDLGEREVAALDVVDSLGCPRCRVPTQLGCLWNDIDPLDGGVRNRVFAHARMRQPASGRLRRRSTTGQPTQTQPHSARLAPLMRSPHAKLRGS